MNEHIAKQVYGKILDSSRILLIPHQHPDGDATGAVTALAGWLKNIGKEYIIFCTTPYTKNLSYLPHVKEMTHDESVWDTPFDAIVVCDSGDLRYAGVDQYMQKQPHAHIINIDHHVTNEMYGTHNLVVIGASSTSEIINRFFAVNKVTITPAMATSLLTGIITDTDNFTNAATSARAIAAASELVSQGAHFDIIKSHMYKSTPLSAFQLWGRIFSRLTKHERLGIVYTYVKQDDLKEFDLEEDDVAGMANFLNAINDGHAGMILKEQTDGTVKGSFRTTCNDIDVSLMAKHFGGGGHKKAAGFTVEGPVEHALEFVLAELEVLFPHKSAIVETQVTI